LTGSSGAAVNSVAFSSGGHTLATGSIDGTVQLWDVATGTPLGDPLTGSSGAAVNSVAFSRDGRTLATGSIDGTVQLWDVATGTPLGDPLTGSSGAAVNSVAFSPDGLTLATSDSSAVRLWEGILWSDFANLESQVCSFVWGNLSADEWRTLAPGLGNHSGC
jgi:WD40 repeat protein